MTRKQTIGVVVSDDIKERVKLVATAKHWSVSQTLALFIEKYWDEWENELGIDDRSPTTSKKPRKPRNPKP